MTYLDYYEPPESRHYRGKRAEHSSVLGWWPANLRPSTTPQVLACGNAYRLTPATL